MGLCRAMGGGEQAGDDRAQAAAYDCLRSLVNFIARLVAVEQGFQSIDLIANDLPLIIQRCWVTALCALSCFRFT